MRYRMLFMLFMLAIAVCSPLAVYGDEIELRQTACRLFDSRQIGGLNAGPKITSATIETSHADLDAVVFTANGRSYNAQGGESGCRVPSKAGVTGATGVIVSVVVFQPNGVGNATLWPAGLPQPFSTSINSSGAVTEVTSIMARLGAAGQLSLASTIPGSHYVVDLVGQLNLTPVTAITGGLVSDYAELNNGPISFTIDTGYSVLCAEPFIDVNLCDDVSGCVEVSGHVVEDNGTKILHAHTINDCPAL